MSNNIYVYQNDEGTLSLVYSMVDIDVDKMKKSHDIPSSKPVMQFTVNPDKQFSLCADDPKQSLFSSWEFDNPTKPTKIVVNMDKAKTRFIEIVREYRLRELGELDTQMVRALGSGDTARIQEIEVRKQELRDLPGLLNVDHIKTVQELLSYKPKSL